MRVAHVVVDVPATAIDRPFDYRIPDDVDPVAVGSCVLVEFARRRVAGWVVGLAGSSSYAGELKPVEAVLGEPAFSPESAEVARWIASEYLCPLSEALRLFLPPGGRAKVVRAEGEDGTDIWRLVHTGAGPVDDRWVFAGPERDTYVPRANATMQRAILDAISSGPVRAAELAADLGAVSGALAALGRAGAVSVEHRRRMREVTVREKAAVRHAALSDGQRSALSAIGDALDGSGGVIVLDGVTGSGKTEVYLRAIERVVEGGGTACVLVPEISLTPQTVGRFRSRFGDAIAVLHSRLSDGERYDQWDRARTGEARIVIGARSALFAPLEDLRLIVIDEEHEPSYKQGSAPRYHARDVAVRRAGLTGATVVLGSATPSMEALHRCEAGEWTRVRLPERVGGAHLPAVTVVDMAREFAAGHRSMFSRPLIAGLQRVRDADEKAVVFLNRRGFASFLLCRECGFVPTCDSCTTSLTYHESGDRLMCHHCASTRAVPAACPQCGSPYLRQFGAGTQRVEAELTALLEGWPVVRMDADTTKGKGAHERLLAEFESLSTGVLLGTQMIAKGLDYPEVTLVGVISADVTLNLPDFRAAERTYQLLEQVAGRAGRGARAGEVVIQTYRPDHPAVVAAATHDPAAFYESETRDRRELGYPPFGRLADVHVRGRDRAEVATTADAVARALEKQVPDTWRVLGPSPSPLARLKGVWRWHVLVKAPEGADLAGALGAALASVPSPDSVTVGADVDALELL